MQCLTIWHRRHYNAQRMNNLVLRSLFVSVGDSGDSGENDPLVNCLSRCSTAQLYRSQLHAVKLRNLLKTDSVTSMFLKCRKSSWLQGIVLLFPFKLRCLKPCFFNVPETLLQNKLNSDVARFTIPPTNQTCLPTNQVVSGCEKLLQKVKGSFTFCNKTCRYCAFQRPKINLRLAQDVSSVYGATSA